MMSSAVVPIGEARARLTGTVRRFREGSLEPVVVGSHRRPEAVIVPYSTYEELRAGLPSTRTTLDRLRDVTPLIRRIAFLNKLDDIAVFGSVARGDDRAESDVDFLVTPCDDATLFDLSQFATDMEQVLSRSVDVVSRRALTGDDATILAEAVRL